MTKMRPGKQWKLDPHQLVLNAYFSSNYPPIPRGTKIRWLCLQMFIHSRKHGLFKPNETRHFLHQPYVLYTIAVKL